jgi:hypothetical protein
MSSTIRRAKAIRADLALWDGRTNSVTRLDASGGTVTGLPIGAEVDVLQVYGAGTARTRASIATAISSIGSLPVTLLFSPGTWSIDASISIPSNFTCHIARGCVFSVDSGQTLTFSGPVQRESDTWTSGAGSVSVTASNNVLLHRSEIVALSQSMGILASLERTAFEISAGVTPVNYAYEPGDVRRYGFLEANSAAANKTAFDNAVLATPLYGTLRFPEGTFLVNPLTITDHPIKLVGAGEGKHAGFVGAGRTILKCEHTTEFALTLKLTTGYAPYHVEGIRFFGNQVGYGGLHFGSDVAAGGSYGNNTGIVVDCSFNQFTTYGLALRRVFDMVVERINCTEVKNAASNATAGMGIALIANNPASSSDTTDMTVVTIRDCDTSNNYKGLYVEECEVLKIINHQASGNHRNGIHFYAREKINNIYLQGGYFEVNNASRVDTGWGATLTRNYFDIDFERDTTSTKSANNITGLIIENPFFGSLTAGSGKMHFQHTFGAWVKHRTTSIDAPNIAVGNDASNIAFEIVNDISPQLEAGGAFPTPSSVMVSTDAALLTRNVDIGEYSGSFTGTLTGMTAGTTGTVNWVRIGKRVRLEFRATIEGTSNTTSMTMTGLSAAIQPVRAQLVTVSELEDNGVAYSGVASFGAGSGTVTFFLDQVSGAKITRSSTAFTNSGTKGIFVGCRIDYDLD